MKTMNMQWIKYFDLNSSNPTQYDLHFIENKLYKIQCFDLISLIL